ncbi:MAG: hypothetical protein ABIK84_00580 [candidate division WOR-3 bacterium]
MEEAILRGYEIMVCYLREIRINSLTEDMRIYLFGIKEVEWRSRP